MKSHDGGDDDSYQPPSLVYLLFFCPCLSGFHFKSSPPLLLSSLYTAVILLGSRWRGGGETLISK